MIEGFSEISEVDLLYLSDQRMVKFRIVKS